MRRALRVRPVLCYSTGVVFLLVSGLLPSMVCALRLRKTLRYMIAARSGALLVLGPLLPLFSFNRCFVQPVDAFRSTLRSDA
jgi:hypothetical protein